jgi:hypothetical protein
MDIVACKVYPPDWHYKWACPHCKGRSATYSLEGRTNTGRIAERVSCASCRSYFVYFWREDSHDHAILSRARIRRDDGKFYDGTLGIDVRSANV